MPPIDPLLFDAVPLPALVAEADSLQIVAANPAAAERYGYSVDELTKLAFSNLLDADSVSRRVTERELANGQHVLVDLQRHRRKDGSIFPAQCATREVLIEGQHFVMFAVTELSELRPLDAEERFLEKMEALTRLGGGIAHEFNNLMAAILATTDLALGSPHIVSSVRDDLLSIRAAGQRAALVTGQLMAFSGNQSIALRPTDLNQLVNQLRPLLQHVLPEPVSLQLDLRATHHAHVDPARLEQVILNLVLNAVEAMPGGGTLTVRNEDIGDSVSLVVADTGRGMDEMSLARLFEPFQSTKGPGGGHGLGLASVYGSVRQMKGTTDIESVHGKGTRVRMIFARANPVPATVSPARADSVQGSEVVLVVEDEPSVRAPICRTLRDLGYFVIEANNGEDALRVMQEHHSPIHLVITDVMMPEMDGSQLVALLRSWYPQMRVLFISGYSPQYLEAQGGTMVRGGAFLAKPFKLAEFTRLVRDMLDAEWMALGEAG